MALPKKPQFEEDYLAFVASYAPDQDSDGARLEFVERLQRLLELAALSPGISEVEPTVGPTSATPSHRLELVPPDVRWMRIRNAGWIARLKGEEEMGGKVPWPIKG